ncbi:MAG: hypothetical protein WAT91_07070 [Saprospiraceae bacterium]
MKNSIFRFVAISICFAFILSCGKDDPVNPQNKEPLITHVGTPVGSPVTASIDATGGTLTSGDGIVQLTIPAGAVNTATVFGIQAISNYCPGGVGSAYRLSPEGTIFLQPVTLSFTYADTSIVDEKVLGIAYQDVDHTWLAPEVISLNEPENKISVKTRHFSDWSFFERLTLRPRKASVYLKDQLTLKITFVGKLSSITDAQGIELHHLNTDNSISTSWHADAGTIEKMGDDRAIYTAPASVPSENPDDVSVTFHNLSFTQNGRTVNNPTYHSKINVYGDEAYYQVTFSSSRSIQPVGNNWFTEKDLGYMKVLRQGDSVTIYNVVNSKAEITPGQLYDPVTECTTTVMERGDGPYNTPDSIKLTGFYLSVTHQIYIGVSGISYPTGQLPSFEIACPGASTMTEGGGITTAEPSAFSFDANLQTQEILVNIPGYGAFPDGYFKTSIARLR